MRRKLGLALLAASFLPWVAFALLPFFDFSASEVIAISGGLYLAGQIAFALSLALIGKEAWIKIKARLRLWRARRGSSKDQIEG